MTQGLFHPSERIVCREQFGLLLNEMGLIGEAIEIGTYIGEFAIPFLANWKGKMLHVVDPWMPYKEYQEDDKFTVDLADKFAVFKERTHMFSDRIIIHKMMSEAAVSRFMDERLDFIYLDGNHNYDFIKRDIELYWPKLKPGGIFAGHDFEANGKWAQHVRRAVLEFFGGANIPIYYVSGDAHSWYVYKRPRNKSRCLTQEAHAALAT